MKQFGTEAVLYLVQNIELNDEEENMAFQVMLNSCGDDQKLRQLLIEYWTVFQEKLPDMLLPDCGLLHEINTSDHQPITIQAYQLSMMQLDEQTKQITELLKKRLIQKSLSS